MSDAQTYFWDNTQKDESGGICVKMIRQDGEELFMALGHTDSRALADSLLSILDGDADINSDSLASRLVAYQREYQRGRANGMVEMMRAMREVQ